MKFKDIFFSGITFWVFFFVIYYILERMKLVPFIAIYRIEWLETFDWNDPSASPNYHESFIGLILIIQALWIGSQMLYWRLFKKQKIE